MGNDTPGNGVDRLRETGAKALCVDAMDRDAVFAAVRDISPDVIIDQLTLLPADPADIIRSIPADTELHKTGEQIYWRLPQPVASAGTFFSPAGSILILPPAGWPVRIRRCAFARRA